MALVPKSLPITQPRRSSSLNADGRGQSPYKSFFTSSGKQMLPQLSHACFKLSQRNTFIYIHILVPLCLTKQHGEPLKAGINHWRYIRRVCMCIYVMNLYINILSVFWFPPPPQDIFLNFRPEGRRAGSLTPLGMLLKIDSLLKLMIF